MYSATGKHCVITNWPVYGVSYLYACVFSEHDVMQQAGKPITDLEINIEYILGLTN